ncbi:MAG: nicotinamide mononucleotide transporter [Flavobacteriales bacterium]|nr:nicotinamide mononucleotide transporter [Flavobacteriales bacterium]
MTPSLALEWTSVLLNIGYAYLLGKQVRVGWLLGFVASAIGVGLYALQSAWIMAGLNVFYAVMGLYGWWNWGRAEVVKGVVRYALQRHVLLMLITGAGTAALVWGMHAIGQPGKLLGMEAFIASSAMVATWMMSRKVLENWLYWIVGDLVAVVYNHLIGYDGYALLNVVYIVLAVVGFVRWRKELSAG